MDNKQEELIDRIAERIHNLGLSGLASILLEGIRPLAFVGGQVMWVAQPALGLLADRDRVAQVARLLERPDALDELRARLERNEPL